MTTNVSAWSRRPLKLVAGLSVGLGVLAAFIGVVGGLSLGGAIFTGELAHNLWTLAFLGLPCLQVAIFVTATLKDGTYPRAAAWLYGLVIVILGMVVALPAIA